MEFESPADAWYVWFGVAVVSLGVVGVVVAFPTGPPPDAAATANAIDRVAASEYGASGTHRHDGDELRIGTKQIWLRNDAGTSHATVSVGTLTPVFAADGDLNRIGQQLVDGKPPKQLVAESIRFDDEAELQAAFESLRAALDRDGPSWRRAIGELRVRRVTLDGESIVLIDG